MHSTVPMHAEGANTTLREVGALTYCLSEVARGRELNTELRRYKYRFGEVRESLRAIDSRQLE